LSCRDDDSHLIERVASEFNQLQFYVTQSQGHPLVESIRGVSHSHLHLFLCFGLLYHILFLTCIKFSFFYRGKNKIKQNCIVYFFGENLKKRLSFASNYNFHNLLISFIMYFFATKTVSVHSINHLHSQAWESLIRHL